MNGQVAQMVALTCHGNAFLLNGNSPGFFPNNSTCQFCDRVTFVELVKPLFRKQTEVQVAANPDEWFPFLRQEQARGIRLVRTAQNNPQISDRMSAGFVGGGGAWMMEVLLPKERSEFWQARWEVWNQNAPDQRIWRVTYGLVAREASRPYQDQSLEITAAQLLKALREIHSFSEKHDCSGFTACFSNAIKSLTDSDRHGYHADFAPPGLFTERALAILDAAQSAWVFGAMGSWNDMGFEGESGKEYDRVSEQLFQMVTESICVAANSGRVVRS